MTASFQVPEDGFEHQVDMPQVPRPEELQIRASHRSIFSSVYPSGCGVFSSSRARSNSLRAVDRLPGATPGSPDTAGLVSRGRPAAG